MKKLIIFLLFLLFLFSGSIIFAHPGRTASDGCHYCRTNCDDWGVEWNERHCHGGSSTSTPAPVYTPRSTTIPVYTKTPTPKPTVYVSCSDISDSQCPNHCTMGNDIDCCGNNSSYHWLENQGCYPKVLNCSAIKDNQCSWYCTEGNDADCCEQNLSSYQWYENRGCYPKEEAQCSGTPDRICPSQCDNGWDADCCEQNLSGYQWYENWGCYPKN